MSTSLTLLAVPQIEAGISLTKTTTAWKYSQWKVVAPRIPTDIYVTGFSLKEHKVTIADTTYEILIEIGSGNPGYEVTKIQFPYSFRSDTAISYYRDTLTFCLPEPVFFPELSTISVRYAGSGTSADVVSGIKLNYLASRRVVSPSESLLPENYKSFTAGTGISVGERIR